MRKMGELPKSNICVLVPEDISSTMVNHHHDKVQTTEESSQHNTEEPHEEDEEELDDEEPYALGILGLVFFLLLLSCLIFFFFSFLFFLIFSKSVFRLIVKSPLHTYTIICELLFQNHILLNKRWRSLAVGSRSFQDLNSKRHAR